MNKLTAKISFQNIAIALVIAIFFILDRYLKLLAISSFATHPLKLIGNIFSFQLTANYYIAFSLPLSGLTLNLIILLLVILITIYITYLAFRQRQKKLEIITMAVIWAGALSNLIDRWTYGYVVDYLNLKYFTVFNLADVMISVGALILIIKNLRNK